jgi:hypothetical protein
MPVMLTFAGEKLSCRHLEIATGNVRLGDIVMIEKKKMRVETVQTNCPYIENLTRVFTAYVLRDERGIQHFIRGFGSLKTDVWRVL